MLNMIIRKCKIVASFNKLARAKKFKKPNNLEHKCYLAIAKTISKSIKLTTFINYKCCRRSNIHKQIIKNQHRKAKLDQRAWILMIT